MLKPSVKFLWGEADQVYYIACLIDRYLDPVSSFIYCPQQQEVQEFSDFTKKLIFLNSGLNESEPELATNEALADFIENFQQLYPHLFAQCPLWIHWVVDESKQSLSEA